MKRFGWSPEKNERLRETRGITFEEIVYHIERGGLLDVLEHPNPANHPGQRLFIVDVEGCACIVPLEESEDQIFLRTIIPSRKMTKRYLGGRKP